MHDLRFRHLQRHTLFYGKISGGWALVVSVDTDGDVLAGGSAMCYLDTNPHRLEKLRLSYFTRNAKHHMHQGFLVHIYPKMGGGKWSLRGFPLETPFRIESRIFIKRDCVPMKPSYDHLSPLQWQQLLPVLWTPFSYRIGEVDAGLRDERGPGHSRHMLQQTGLEDEGEVPTEKLLKCLQRHGYWQGRVVLRLYLPCKNTPAKVSLYDYGKGYYPTDIAKIVLDVVAEYGFKKAWILLVRRTRLKYKPIYHGTHERIELPLLGPPSFHERLAWEAEENP